MQRTMVRHCTCGSAFTADLVVVGGIGRRKFIYDLWGDTVNTASRMEAHGLPGSIQVTTDTYTRLRDWYDFHELGTVPVKGKAEMETFLLVGHKRG